MPATKISLDQAKKEKLFYFVANVVVYREADGRCLILKRSSQEKVHPGKYAVPGGKLEWKDLLLGQPTRLNGDVLDYENAVEELLKREVREEAGLDIALPLKYINSVAFIRPDETPVVLVKFAAKCTTSNVTIDAHDFTDYAWVNVEEVKKYDCIQGVHEEVEETIRLFSEKLHSSKKYRKI